MILASLRTINNDPHAAPGRGRPFPANPFPTNFRMFEPVMKMMKMMNVRMRPHHG